VRRHEERVRREGEEGEERRREGKERRREGEEMESKLLATEESLFRARGEVRWRMCMSTLAYGRVRRT
jgi:hypothetical protein